MKPSRFGSLRALLDAYDACAGRGIGIYGGGQFELGRGEDRSSTSPRSSTRTLRTTSRPPATTRPTARGLPTSPLAPDWEPIGFRRTGFAVPTP